MYDVAIIGAGITGCAIAYELGKYNVKAVIVEKENDVSVGTTKANSAIISENDAVAAASIHFVQLRIAKVKFLVQC